jgi:hypothetical protein
VRNVAPDMQQSLAVIPLQDGMRAPYFIVEGLAHKNPRCNEYAFACIDVAAALLQQRDVDASAQLNPWRSYSPPNRSRGQ